jgi:hypothetical protein
MNEKKKILNCLKGIWTPTPKEVLFAYENQLENKLLPLNLQ